MTLDPTRVQAICFDVDGTLSDTDDQWAAMLTRRMAPLRRLFPGGDTRPFARRAVMCAETPGNLVYGLLDRVHLDDEVARLYSHICRHRVGRRPRVFKLVPGVAALLAVLHEHYPLAVVSARDEEGGGRVLFDSPNELLGDFPAHQAACCSLRSVDQ